MPNTSSRTCPTPPSCAHFLSCTPPTSMTRSLALLRAYSPRSRSSPSRHPHEKTLARARLVLFGGLDAGLDGVRVQHRVQRGAEHRRLPLLELEKLVVGAEVDRQIGAEEEQARLESGNARRPRLTSGRAARVAWHGRRAVVSMKGAVVSARGAVVSMKCAVVSARGAVVSTARDGELRTVG
eukprot:1658445-Pleurochrysis_carterae.AAC.2